MRERRQVSPLPRTFATTAKRSTTIIPSTLRRNDIPRMVVISVLLRIRRLLIATTFCRHIPLVKRRSGLPSRRAQKHPQRAAPTRRVMRDCVLNKKMPTFEQPLFLGSTFDLSPLYEECSRRVVRPFRVEERESLRLNPLCASNQLRMQYRRKKREHALPSRAHLFPRRRLPREPVRFEPARNA